METSNISVSYDNAAFYKFDVAVILPAFNEALTIRDTIISFNKALPNARIFVVNNNSNDATEAIARHVFEELQCEGTVLNEKRQGKGNVLRRAFLSIDADVYVLADADMTY